MFLWCKLYREDQRMSADSQGNSWNLIPPPNWFGRSFWRDMKVHERLNLYNKLPETSQIYSFLAIAVLRLKRNDFPRKKMFPSSTTLASALLCQPAIISYFQIEYERRGKRVKHLNTFNDRTDDKRKGKQKFVFLQTFLCAFLLQNWLEENRDF